MVMKKILRFIKAKNKLGETALIATYIQLEKDIIGIQFDEKSVLIWNRNGSSLYHQIQRGEGIDDILSIDIFRNGNIKFSRILCHFQSDSSTTL